MKVTVPMIYAYANEPEITGTDAHAIEAGLQRVLDREQLWILDRDDDGHWYLIPEDQMDAFTAYVYRDGEWPEGVTALGGAPNGVRFIKPTYGGEEVTR